ncbi:hypothetical protein [Rhizobium freirei]|uniref:hypothetical protein n=1 Tax=Rhizobium freirei TaxID=1353277 RepID=UPI000566666E|nr:hypothetical protein [Rhizobium freirei]
MTSAICAARQIQRQQVNPPVGDDWLEDFRRLFAEEFPEPQCEAQKAVEGTSHQRVETNRFSGEAS